MTNQERIDNLIIKVINLTLELREMKEDIKAIETKVENSCERTPGFDPEGYEPEYLPYIPVETINKIKVETETN